MIVGGLAALLPTLDLSKSVSMKKTFAINAALIILYYLILLLAF